MRIEDRLRNAKILIVDDDESIVAFIKDALGTFGFNRIDRAVEPDAVLGHIRESGASLVVLDLHMSPVSGLELLERLRSEESPGSTVPVLMLTGDDCVDSRRQAYEMGADDFLTKPVDTVELALRVANLLSAAALRRDLADHNRRLQEAVRERTEELQNLNAALEAEIAERKQVERNLRTTEQRLRFLLSSGPASIHVSLPNPPYSTTFISENVQAQIGYSPEEFLRDPGFWKDRIHAEDAPRLWSNMLALRSQSRAVEEYRFLHRDGSYRWMRDEMVLIRGESGAPIEIIRSWTDVTERRQAEETLSQQAMELASANARLQEFDRLKSEFVSTASHEMRTPLTVIREFALLLRDGAIESDPKEREECFEAIERNCDRMTALLDNLLDFHRIEAGSLNLKRTRVDLNALLEECYRDFVPKCKAKGLHLELDLRENLPPVLADAFLVNQVVYNLIGNAAKFTPEGGRITLRSGARRGIVQIEVEDTGRGIPEPDLESVFEPFRQINRTEGPGMRGTGLGLTISKRIVEEHGGTIEVRSAEGKGACFRFTLPQWSETDGLQAFLADRLSPDSAPQPATLLLIRPTRGEEPSGGLEQYAEIAKTAFRTSDAGLAAKEQGYLACVLQTGMAGAEAALARFTSALSSELPGSSSFEYSLTDLSAIKNIACVFEYAEANWRPVASKHLQTVKS